jgi:hypothetical protein
MLFVDQGCVRRFGCVVPFSGRGFPARILGCRDDFKIVTL